MENIDVDGSIEKPIRIMILHDSLSRGTHNKPMSGQDMKLLALCRKHKIKYEEPKSYPYDRVWITPKTFNQKLAVIKFFGIDKLAELKQQV